MAALVAPVLVSWGCHDTLSQTLFETTEIYSLSSRSQKSKVKMSAGLVPSGDSGGEPSCLLQLLGGSRCPWLVANPSNLCLRLHMASPCWPPCLLRSDISLSVSCLAEGDAFSVSGGPGQVSWCGSQQAGHLEFSDDKWLDITHPPLHHEKATAGAQKSQVPVVWDIDGPGGCDEVVLETRPIGAMRCNTRSRAWLRLLD